MATCEIKILGEKSFTQVLQKTISTKLPTNSMLMLAI